MIKFVKVISKRILQWVGKSKLAKSIVALLVFLRARNLISHQVALKLVSILCEYSKDIVIMRKIRLFEDVSRYLYLDLKFQISRELLFKPLNDYADLLTLKLFCALSKTANTVFDVGANIGLFTYLAAVSSASSTIYAYEPNAELAAIIRRNVSINGWQSRVHTFESAIGDRKGTVDFFVVENDTESTLKMHRLANRKVLRTLRIGIVPLDYICETNQIDSSLSLFKIDVEGAEDLVLDGFEKTLMHGKKPDLIIEILGKGICEGWVDRLIHYGFNGFYIASRKFISFKTASDLEGQLESGYYNFYFTQKSENKVHELFNAITYSSVTL